MSYLKHFPIDVLKVDKSFVQEITAGSNSALIVSAVIGMGKSLKHRVIAEGVETGDQLAFLQAEGCGEGQGYFFSRPLVARQFAGVLETGDQGHESIPAPRIGQVVTGVTVTETADVLRARTGEVAQ